MRVTLNQQGLHELLNSPQSEVVREVASLTRRVENRAKQKVGVDTGRLRSSIQGTVRTQGTRIVGTVGSSVQYARAHHDGTGVYGPTARPIRPTRSPFLVFKPKGSQTFVFAKEVRGSRGTRYLVLALREVVPWPVRTI